MLISVVITTFNHERFIKRCIESIMQQTIFKECELILINANSPGHEEKVITRFMKQYPNIIYIKLDKDPGVYGV